jgi:glutaredoxin-related protein
MQTIEIGTAEDIRKIFPQFKTNAAVAVAFCNGRFKAGIRIAKGTYNIGYLKGLLIKGENPFNEKAKRFAR